VALTLLEPKEQRLLKNVERTTRQPIPLGRLPTLVDVRARKRDLTRAAVEAQLGDADSLEPWRTAVDALSANADLADVAAAALAALHGQLHPGEAEEPEVELPTFEPSPSRPERKPPARKEAAPRRGEPRAHRVPEGGWDRIFVGLGARAGLRVGDLVGAIANEADLERTEIGAVQLGDLFSFVEVAAGRGDDVIRALSASTLRGRKVKVERDRGSRTPRTPRSRD
jgi:ATP-dependent RNA helicase DeaD